jgi:glycosyltransferase involved in cell wall biosynthesis
LTDAELEIPPIAAFPADVARPRWSVMIPAYNSAATIGTTLSSVLAQATAADAMQIAVVDNASTDETLAVIERIAPAASGGRVEVIRNPMNIGLVGNWNACIKHARGELVLILHSDDYLQPGYFAAVEAAFDERADADLCLVRALIVDAWGEPERLARRLGSTGEELSVWALAYGNEFYAPGVVVRRSCYERLGGFTPALAYVPDWEMWLRILAHGKGVYVNEPLARYREMAGNATSRLSRTADDLRELIRFGAVVARRVPGFERRPWREYLKSHAAWAVKNWQRAGDAEACRANYAYWRQFATPGEKLDEMLVKAKKYGVEAERRVRRALRGK